MTGFDLPSLLALPAARFSGPLLADEHGSFWFPRQASIFAPEVDFMFDIILWICVFFFVLIIGCLAVFTVQYRAPKGEPAKSRVRHHTLLELSWSVLPCFLLVFMFVRGAQGYRDMVRIPEGAYEVQVTAFKWGWSFTYPGGIVVPELHAVKGQPTRLVLRSQDVLHSLFVPSFRIKKDVVPGRFNTMWFTATESNPAGEHFDLYCTEYCGKDHSMMKTKVIIHETQAEFDAWLAEAEKPRSDETPESYGMRIYETRGCKGCHSLDGSARTGPSFQGVFGRTEKLADGSEVVADENYIRESILEPKSKIVAGYQPVMPSYKGQLKDFQIDGVIAYLKSLKAN
jgi:cytochrome c oxidase subunit 2